MRRASFVPDFGQVPAGRLSTVDYPSLTTRMESDLAASGVDRYLLALDVTFNHDRGSVQSGYWQLHFWGVVLEGASPRIDELKKLINASGRVHRPVHIPTAPIRPSSVRAIMAYAMKNGFKRRETMIKSRPGRAPFRDTQERPLLDLPLVELMVFLDQIGPHGRLLTKGVDFENLQRARAVRASRRRARRLRKLDHSRRAKKGGARR